MKAIGGDFSLDPAVLVGPPGKQGDSPVLYESGRAALFALLLAIEKGEKLSGLALPGYICQSVVSASRAAGADIEFYQVREDLLPDEGSLRRVLSGARTAIVLVNYFGLLDMRPIVSQVREIREDAFVILDRVQAPFTMDIDEGADAAFASFRKAWPAVQGAALWMRSSLPAPREECRDGPASLRLLGMIRKHLFVTRGIGDEEDFLRPLAESEQALDLIRPFAAGPEGSYRLQPRDKEDAAERRRMNYEYLRGRLASLGLPRGPELTPGAVPLFMPVLVNDRDTVRRELARQRMFFPAHWPIPAELQRRDHELAARLYSHELSLVIDQRYRQEDMERIARAVAAVSSVGHNA
jgi:hypothetical protein